MKRLEEQNNRLFIDAYGLADELTPEVPIKQITLTVNPAYRYGGKLSEAEQWTRFRQDTMKELVSYAIGCMMGRYSLDKPRASSTPIAATKASTPAVTPVSRQTTTASSRSPTPDWFDDDAVHCACVEFISVAWEADSPGRKPRPSWPPTSRPGRTSRARDTLRRYLCDSFFKDHLQTYKKRPIYWLFSSGKQKALQCLVYLHRYNEGTLSRMRSEYVIPLQGMMAARLETACQGDIQAATSSVPTRSGDRTKERDEARKTADGAARLRREAAPLRRPAHHPGPRRRREGQLRQVRGPARRGEGRPRREGGGIVSSKLPINLEDLLRQRAVEGERIEYKAGWNPETVLHTVCAFANDFHNLGGGYIILGVEEKEGRPVLPPKGISPKSVTSSRKRSWSSAITPCSLSIIRSWRAMS